MEKIIISKDELKECCKETIREVVKDMYSWDWIQLVIEAQKARHTSWDGSRITEWRNACDEILFQVVKKLKNKWRVDLWEMQEKEFNLSEWFENSDTVIPYEKVREFIRLLKEKLAWIRNKGFYVFDDEGIWLLKKINKEIDKLAGEKLR